MKDITDEDLKRSCESLSKMYEHGSSKDLDAAELFSEIKIFTNVRPESTTNALKVLQYLYPIRDSYPNLTTAYRILLTIPVTVASAERSFSKLKLIKNYLRSTMKEERLCGLAIISIEHELAQEIEIPDLIDAFAFEKARKLKF